MENLNNRAERNDLVKRERRLHKKHTHGQAMFNDARSKRFILKREWLTIIKPIAENVLWIMLNPSTADEKKDDPTIRRCIGFTYLFGYNSLSVVNAVPYIASNPEFIDVPKYLDDDADVFYNKEFVQNAIDDSKIVVLAWGNIRKLKSRELENIMMDWIREVLPGDEIKKVKTLGITKGGWPRHPLYVPYLQDLEQWIPATP